MGIIDIRIPYKRYSEKRTTELLQKHVFNKPIGTTLLSLNQKLAETNILIQIMTVEFYTHDTESMVLRH